MSDHQASVRQPERGSQARRRAKRVFLGIVELAILFAVFVVGRFALSCFKPSQSRDTSLEGWVVAPPPVPAALTTSVRRRASFDGHPYICAEDPQRPGNYAVVFASALQGSDEFAYAAMRHAVLTAYGEDLSGVAPDVSQQGEALRVEFRVDGIAYVVLAAWNASHGELIAFSLHREE